MDYQEINKNSIGKWESTLKFLIAILTKNNISYYLSASGLEYILEKDIYPYDIDLFISKRDIGKAYGLLKNLSTSEMHEWNNRYVEFQGKYNDVPFEICEWEEEPKQLINKMFKDFEVSIIG